MRANVRLLIVKVNPAMRAGQQKKSRLAGGPRELGRQETEAWKTTKSDQQIKPKSGSLTNSKRRIYCLKTKQAACPPRESGIQGDTACGGPAALSRIGAKIGSAKR